MGGDFLQNIDSSTIIWIAIAAMVLLGILVVNNKARRGLAFAARALLGIAAVFAINTAFAGFGFAVSIGINFLTIAVIALLGLPGIAMLYSIGFMI